MDKTHNISLGRSAFLVNETAYKMLKKYLMDIRISLGSSDDKDEIVSDVEYRMAELLRQRKGMHEVITTEDVDYLIAVLGEPKDFSSDETEGASDEFIDNQVNGKKKLYRDPDDKILGGVCSGLSYFTGVDTVWIRLALVLLPFLDFVFLGISTTSIVFIYFILWIVVPLAKTTSEKLQMRGYPVNVDSIKDFFVNNSGTINNEKHTLQKKNKSKNLFFDISRVIIKIIGFAFLGLLLFISIILLLTFLTLVLGIGATGLQLEVSGIMYNEMFDYIFENKWEYLLSFFSLGAIMIIPSILLVILGMRMISKRFSVSKYIPIILIIGWVIGWIGLFGVCSNTSLKFLKPAYNSKVISIDTAKPSTIVVEIENTRDWDDLKDLLEIKKGNLAIPIDKKVIIKPSKTGKSYLELNYSARGRNRKLAMDNLSYVDYNYSVKDSLVHLDRYLFIKNGEKWRNQNIIPTLYIAEDKQFMLKNFDEYKIGDKYANYWNTVKPSSIYLLTGDVLKCINCPLENEHSNVNDSIDVKIDSTTLNTY